jgi:hypothetical protein
MCIEGCIIIKCGHKYAWHGFGLDWTGLNLSRAVGTCRRGDPTSRSLKGREVSRTRIIAVFWTN